MSDSARCVAAAPESEHELWRSDDCGGAGGWLDRPPLTLMSRLRTLWSVMIANSFA